MPITPDDIRAASQRIPREAVPVLQNEAPDVGNFGRGVSSGIDQTQGMLYGLAAMAGQESGIQSLSDWGMRGFERNQQEAAAFAPDVQRIKDIDSVDKFFDWAAGTIGQAVPSFAMTLGAGGVGGIVGKNVVKRSIASGVTKGAAAKLTEQGFSKEAAEAAVKRVLADPLKQKALAAGLRRGAISGAYVASAGMNIGDVYTELRQAGIEDAPQYALGAGALMGALDIIPEMMIFDDLMDATVKKQVVEGLGRSLLKSVGKQTAAEGTTEGLQEAVAVGTRALADPTFDPKSKESIERIIDAFAAGAIVGTVTGGVSGVAKRAMGSKAPEAAPGSRPAASQNFPDDQPKGFNQLGDAMRAAGIEGTTAPDEDTVDVEQLEIEGDPGLPRRYFGKDESIGTSTDSVTAYKVSEGSAATLAARLAEQNTDFAYEVVPVQNGFAVAEYLRDPTNSEAGQFDRRRNVEIPIPEMVQESVNDSLRVARNFDTRTVGGKAELASIARPFEFKSDAGVETRPVVINRITQLGMKLDQDKSGGLRQRVSRGLRLGITEMMLTPTRQSGKGVFGSLVTAAPTEMSNDSFSFPDDTVVYEVKQKPGRPGLRVLWKDIKDGVAGDPDEDAWRGPLGPTATLKSAPDPVERPQETAGEQTQVYDPVTDNAQSEEQQAASMARAANDPLTVPNSDLGVVQPAAPAQARRVAHKGDHVLLSKITADFAQRFRSLGQIQLVASTTQNNAAMREGGAAARDWAKQLVGYDSLVKTHGEAAAAQAARFLLEAVEVGTKGIRIQLTGKSIIYVAPELPLGKKVAVLAHELGHAIAQNAYEALPAEQRQLLIDAWRRSTSGEPNVNEWLANQFAAWIAKRPHARELVNKWLQGEGTPAQKSLAGWFERTAQALHEFWKRMVERFQLDQTFSQFMDAVAVRSGWDTQGLRHNPPSPFELYFSSLGPGATSTWSGLPRRQNFTPPRDMWRGAIGKVRPMVARFSRVSAGLESTGAVAQLLHDKVFATVQGVVRRMRNSDGERIGAFDEFIDLFHKKPGQRGGLSFQQEVDQERRDMHSTFEKALSAMRKAAGNDPAKYKQLNDEVAKWLRDADSNPNAKPPASIEPFVTIIRNAYDYANRFAQSNELPMKSVRNYFTFQFDMEKLRSERDRFIEVVKTQLKKTEKEAIEFYEEITSTASGIPEEFLNDVEIDQQAPGARMIKHRYLTPDERRALHEFTQKDLSTLFYEYSKQLTKRAIFNRYFGMSGREIGALLKDWDQKASDLLQDWVTQGDPRGQLRRDLSDPNKPVYSPGLLAEIENVIGKRPKYDPTFKFRKLMERAQKDHGASDDQVRFMYNVLNTLLGRTGQDMSPGLRRAFSYMMLYQNVRLLAFTVLGALPDLATPMIRGNGVTATLRSYIRANGENKALLNKMMQAYHQSVEHYNEHILADGLSNDASSTAAYRMSDKFFKWTGVRAYENWSRRMALSTGLDYILEAAENGETAKLEELGITADDVKLWVSDGQPIYGSSIDLKLHTSMKIDPKTGDRLYPAEVIRAKKVSDALVRFMHEAKVSGIERASKTMWGNDPRFMLFWHLKSFMYEFQNRVMTRIWYDLNKSNLTGEQLHFVAPMLIGLALAGFGLELRELLQYSLFGKGDEARTDKMSGTEYLYTLYQRAGYLGVGQYATDAVEASIRGRPPVLTLVGPTLAQANDIMEYDVDKWGPTAVPILNSFTGARQWASEQLK